MYNCKLDYLSTRLNMLRIMLHHLGEVFTPKPSSSRLLEFSNGFVTFIRFTQFSDNLTGFIFPTVSYHKCVMCTLTPKNVPYQSQKHISQHTTYLVPHTGFEPIRPRSIMDTASNSGSASALFRQQGFLIWYPRWDLNPQAF